MSAPLTSSPAPGATAVILGTGATASTPLTTLPATGGGWAVALAGVVLVAVGLMLLVASRRAARRRARPDLLLPDLSHLAAHASPAASVPPASAALSAGLV